MLIAIRTLQAFISKSKASRNTDVHTATSHDTTSRSNHHIRTHQASEQRRDENHLGDEPNGSRTTAARHTTSPPSCCVTNQYWLPGARHRSPIHTSMPWSALWCGLTVHCDMDVEQVSKNNVHDSAKGTSAAADASQGLKLSCTSIPAPDQVDSDPL